MFSSILYVLGSLGFKKEMFTAILVGVWEEAELMLDSTPLLKLGV